MGRSTGGFERKVTFKVLNGYKVGNMSVFRHADGYVRIKLWGSGAERFMVLCAHKQMPLWEIEAQGKYIYTNMRLKDFYNCRKMAHKAGVRAVVVERHGLPFFMSRMWGRSFWIVGLSLFLAGWLISTNMLLHIDIQGNFSISDDIFMDFLKEQGISIGMWKKDIPIEELEKEIRREFEQVTWTSGKLDGTVLMIDVKEYDKPIISGEEQTASIQKEGSSLYATADGVISGIYVRNGVPMVKKGAEVKKGDLLVDGQVPVYNEEQTVAYYQYYDADADIGIETTLEVSYALPKVYVEKNYTGRTSEGNYFYLGPKVYRNKWGERKFQYKDVTYEHDSTISIGGFSFGLGTFSTKEYAKIEKEYTEEEAKQLLTEEFDKNNSILIEKGVQILEKNVTIEIIMDNWTLAGTMKVIMPAYDSRPIEIPEETDDSEGI